MTRIKQGSLFWLLGFFLLAWSFSGGQEEGKAAESSFILTFPLKEKTFFGLSDRPGRSLVFGGNRVYAYTEAGQIISYDFQEEKILWTFRLSHPALTAPALIANNLFVVDQGNNLSCFSLEGELLWEKRLPEPVAAAQTVWNDKLILASTRNQVVAVSISSGEIIWRAEVDSPVKAFEVMSHTVMTALSSRGMIYLISSSGETALLGSTGQELLPFVYRAEDSLVLATADRFVLCWHLQKKRPVWKLKLGGQVAANPLAVKKKLYVPASNAVLYCLDFRSGEIQWWRPLPSPFVFGMLACGPAILVATLNPPLLCFDASSGQELGRWEIEKEISSPPFLVNNCLALATFDPLSGQGFWRFLEPEVDVSIVVSHPTPLKLGEEVTFRAQVKGFIRPRFEFLLLSGETKKVVQREAEKPSWSWVPLEPGDYTLVLSVRDERRKAEASLSFQVIQEQP